MFKYEVLSTLRSLGLMHFVDNMHYLYNKLRYSKKNKSFLHAYPDIKFPPSYILYESYALDFEDYYEGGKESALWLKNELAGFIDVSNIRILDWGCGPARVVRHLPVFLGKNSQVYGTDYNQRTINWCTNNIPEVIFNVNSVEPPLAFPDNFFDVVYGFSVFTHLSVRSHFQWVDELSRIIHPGGILLITTQGEVFCEKLTSSEKKKFFSGQLIERSKVKEGHRTFSTFHPPAYITKLFSSQWNIVKFTPGIKHSWGLGQDTWIFQRK